MTRSEYLTLRHDARWAVRQHGIRIDGRTWTQQDKDRAWQRVQDAVAKLPERQLTWCYGFIARQTREMFWMQFPQWTHRRIRLRQARRDAAMKARIVPIVSRLGPSVIEQNIAAENARRVVA